MTQYSVVPRSEILGDTGVPLPQIQRDISKIKGTLTIILVNLTILDLSPNKFQTSFRPFHCVTWKTVPTNLFGS